MTYINGIGEYVKMMREREDHQMKIVVLDGYTLNPGDLSWDGLSNLGDLKVYEYTPKEQIVERIGDAEIIFTNKTPLTSEIFSKVPHVRYVGALSTGYNIVDIETAKEHGIAVTNIPTYGTDAVAQYTFALLLEMCSHVGEHSRAVREGAWTACRDFCFWNYPMVELVGKTLGIIGFGRIGQAVSRIALAFGMKVLTFSRSREKVLESDGLRYAELDELLAESDVISLHCPLTGETRGMINRETISKMKDGVMLINTSRGPVVEEPDLAEALNSGKVAGAAVDVVSAEPIKAANPLLTARNCIITPHIAWAPRETRERLMNIAVDNLEAFLRGSPINVVNP